MAVEAIVSAHETNLPDISTVAEAVGKSAYTGGDVSRTEFAKILGDKTPDSTNTQITQGPVLTLPSGYFQAMYVSQIVGYTSCMAFKELEEAPSLPPTTGTFLSLAFGRLCFQNPTKQEVVDTWMSWTVGTKGVAWDPGEADEAAWDPDEATWDPGEGKFCVGYSMDAVARD